VKKRAPKTARVIWFRGQYVPVLFGHSRQDIFGSEDWVARGTIQKIGAIIFALVLFCGSIALFVASVLMRAETSELAGVY
jgi:hypothetical protein